MSNNQAGKGSKPRPVVKEVYDENFDEITWKKEEKKPSIVKGKKVYKY